MHLPLDTQHLRIAVVGLGYVGLPLAVEFGKRYATVGYDINAARIAELRAGRDSTLEVEPELLAQASRQGEPLSVLILDLDHFKQVNDLHGHQAGDEVLRHAARQIIRHTRSSDLVCRYGGEEFVVVLPGVAPAQAAERAEALRAALEVAPARFGVLTLPLTASFGVAGLTDQADRPDRLIGVADRALYEAKAQGRNRVVMARHVEPQTPGA